MFQSKYGGYECSNFQNVAIVNDHGAPGAASWLQIHIARDAGAIVVKSLKRRLVCFQLVSAI